MADACVDDGSAPLVTVVILAYRQAELLNAALESVAGQTLTRTPGAVEVVVVDDASGEEHTAKYRLPAFARLIVLPERRATAAVSRNVALREARGKYVAFLDQDDLCEPERLAAQAELLERDAEAMLTFCHYTRVDEKGAAIAKQDPPVKMERDRVRQFVRRNPVHCPSQVMVRRSVFDRVGIFDETIRGAADWDMWLRIAAEGKVVFDPRPLVKYRHHDGQWSRQSLMMAKGSLKVCDKAERWLLPGHPRLKWLLGNRQARWRRELARIQLDKREELGEVFENLRVSLRLNPWSPRTYGQWIRAMVVCRKHREKAQEVRKEAV